LGYHFWPVTVLPCLSVIRERVESRAQKISWLRYIQKEGSREDREMMRSIRIGTHHAHPNKKNEEG